MLSPLPYLTTQLPGIGGQFKTTPEDFYVEEIPRYPASGSGQHVYVTIEKRNLTTLKAINMIAQALKIKSRQIGYAGLKDAQAVSRQTISIEGVSPDVVESLTIPGIKIIEINRHTNKLKLGHLAGNKFVIKIRNVNAEAHPHAEEILNQLVVQGIPNYFGQQRFGTRNNTHLLGLALIQNNEAEFLAELLGRPHPQEMAQAQAARTAFDEGNWQKALDLWPSVLRQERVVLQRLVRYGEPAGAIRGLDKRLKRLFVSACQSYLFNCLLSERVADLNQVILGDVVYLHRNGACFVVESVAEVQPRAEAFELSPAGPLFGKKYLPAQAEPDVREQSILEQFNLKPDDFNISGAKAFGSRRPYRIPLTDAQLTWQEGLVVSFTLPAGCYATMVLRELIKDDEIYEQEG